MVGLGSVLVGLLVWFGPRVWAIVFVDGWLFGFCGAFVVMFCLGVVGYVWFWSWLVDSFGGLILVVYLLPFVLGCD